MSSTGSQDIDMHLFFQDYRKPEKQGPPPITIIVDSQHDEIQALRKDLEKAHGCLSGMRQALVDAGGFERTIAAIDTILLKR
jgi:hypothetical protein